MNYEEFCRRNFRSGWITVKLEKEGVNYIGCWHPDSYTGLVYSLANGKNALEGVTLYKSLETEPNGVSIDFTDRIPFTKEMFADFGYTIIPHEYHRQ